MNDLEKIKKDYGEKMSHFCRDNFSTILEHDGLLYDILSSHFAPNKFLYDDLKYNYDGFKNFIYSFFYPDIEEIEVDKTPKELLDEAGYILYECKSEEDIQNFKKYYAKGEELCTFKGDRLERCYVFFAVKKDVDQIKRDEFKNPMRQDKYGTSVISIQFSRGNVNTLSIKNRYNHTVNDPDATFSNNLENIIAGLTKSFEKEYNLKVNSDKSNLSPAGYVLADDKRFYKFNFEENNIYYCPNNIIIDHGKVITDYQENERYIIFEYFILDLKEKKIILYDKRIDDDLVRRFNNISKIEVIKNKENGSKEIKIKTPDGNAKIVLSDESIIKEYEDDIKKDIGKKFLVDCNHIEKINILNANRIGDDSLINCYLLKKLNAPNVLFVGHYVLENTPSLDEINMPNVETIGDNFLCYNKKLQQFNFPNLKEIGKNFLISNNCIKFVCLPNVKKIDRHFMLYNEVIIEFRAPEVLTIGDGFLRNCTKIKELYLDSVINVGNDFLPRHTELEKIYMPNLKKIGESAFIENNSITELFLPNVEEIGDEFFKYNHSLKKIFMPKVSNIGSEFLLYNETLEELEMPDYTSIGKNFLDKHPKFSHRESSVLSDADGNKIRFY